MGANSSPSPQTALLLGALLLHHQAARGATLQSPAPFSVDRVSRWPWGCARTDLTSGGCILKDDRHTLIEVPGIPSRGTGRWERYGDLEQQETSKATRGESGWMEGCV